MGLECNNGNEVMDWTDLNLLVGRQRMEVIQDYKTTAQYTYVTYYVMQDVFFSMKIKCWLSNRICIAKK